MFKLGWNDGHTLSGTGSGAVGIIKETDRNRRIGNLVKKIILNNYADVQWINCTIDKSENDLAAAVKIANDNNVDLFISNHANTGGGVGFEGFYSRYGKKEDIGKGKIIYDTLVNTKSCLKARRYCDDFSYKKYDLYVLKNTKMAALLFEIGFLDNKECVNAVNDEEVAKAYVEGIVKAYNLKKKEKVEFDMNKIVVYAGDADLFGAVMVAQKNQCPLMKLSDYKASGLKVQTVIQIGGKAEDTNRYVTFKNAAALV